MAEQPTDRTRAILQEALGITDDVAEGLPTEAMARDAVEFIQRARQMSETEMVAVAEDPAVLPRIDMYEPDDGVAEIDGVLWIPSAELDIVREEEEAAAAAQQNRLEALRRSHEFIAVQEPETRVSASLLLSAVRWVLTGQVDD